MELEIVVHEDRNVHFLSFSYRLKSETNEKVVQESE